MIFKMD